MGFIRDVFVNDAFGTAHRAHASNVGIASTGIPTVAGFLMEKEIKFIGEAVEEPKRPMVAILGGAKVSDKIGVIENLIPKADKILIGGGMTYTFYKAKGMEIGNSLVEADKVELAKELIEKAGDKLVLPVDSITAAEFSNDVPTEEHTGDVPEGQMGLDIGPETIALFAETLKGAKQLFGTDQWVCSKCQTLLMVPSVFVKQSQTLKMQQQSSVVEIQLQLQNN